MTNYEKHFGAPDLAAETEVGHYADALTHARMVRVPRLGKLVAAVKARYYGEWLESEADND